MKNDPEEETRKVTHQRERSSYHAGAVVDSDTEEIEEIDVNSIILEEKKSIKVCFEV